MLNVKCRHFTAFARKAATISDEPYCCKFIHPIYYLFIFIIIYFRLIYLHFIFYAISQSDFDILLLLDVLKKYFNAYDSRLNICCRYY